MEANPHLTIPCQVRNIKKKYDFPIKETNGETQMKNSNPSMLPHLHGLILEDPNTFLFVFSIVCKTYHYT
jgi:hypothetical protein